MVNMSSHVPSCFNIWTTAVHSSTEQKRQVAESLVLLCKSHHIGWSKQKTAHGEMRVPKQSDIEGINYPELVFGLVGPIGVDMDDLQAALSAALSQVGYQSKTIHLTQLLKKYEKDLHGPKEITLYADKIATANAFCKAAENGAAMAALAISEIKSIRKNQTSLSGEDEKTRSQRAIPKTAYIIRQLKREDERKV